MAFHALLRGWSAYSLVYHESTTYFILVLRHICSLKMSSTASGLWQFMSNNFDALTRSSMV